MNYQDGFTDFRFLEMGVIRLLAERAREVIAVMDSSKIGKRSRKQVLSLQQVDRMVTDDAVPDTVREKYEEQGLVLE